MSDEDNLSEEDLAAEHDALTGAARDDKGDEPGKGSTERKPPWGDKDFDPDRAWRAIQKQRESEKQLKAKLKEYEDRDKSESEKLAEDRDSHKSRADKAESELARYKVAAAKGLTPGQAKRLVGSTEDELAADADEMLAELGGNGSTSTTKPKERLRGGGEPDDEPEEDLSKVVADIPRI